MTLAFLETELIHLLRIALACICGGIIGLEREHREKSAGLKTHIMIALAASLMMIISKYGFLDVMGIEGLSCDVSRVAAGIITGLGIFSGCIIFTSKQGIVSGITTAAGIWVTIAIGMSLGAGMYFIGLTTTLLVEIIQIIFHKNLKIYKQPMRGNLHIRIGETKKSFEQIEKDLAVYDIVLRQMRWDRKGKNNFVVRCQATIPASMEKDRLMELMTAIPEVEEFELFA